MNEVLLVSICAIFYLAVKLSDRKINKVQYYYKWCCYYAYSLVMSSVLCCVCVWRGRSVSNIPKTLRWLSPMASFHGLCWHLENAEVMERTGRGVIVSNHQSSLDIIGMLFASQTIETWIPTCKKEIIYLGPVGLLSYLVGAVFIDRHNPRHAYRSLQEAQRLMVEKELKIWLFPEGTRNMQRAMLPFKRGAFKMAVATQAPIIPVVYSPYYFAYEDRCIFENGGHIIMRCLDPIPTTGLTMDDIPELTQRLQKIVQDEYEKLSKEVLTRFPGANQVLATAK